MGVRTISRGVVRHALVGSGFLALCFSIPAQQVLQRGPVTISVEPYAPNILRVSLSLRHDDAIAGPGFGIRSKPSETGWTKSSGNDGDGMISSVLRVHVAPQGPKRPATGTQGDISRFFGGSVPWVGLKIATADGKTRREPVSDEG